jgi:hypothetical protein
VCPEHEDVVIFVTRGTIKASLAGDPSERADALCMREANAAGLQGRYSSLLTTTGTLYPSPVRRRIELVDGTLVAESLADLLDGALAAPIALAADGTFVDGTVLTGMEWDGSPTGHHCAGWRREGDGSKVNRVSAFDRALGTVGLSTATSAAWTHAADRSCPELDREPTHLYCVGVRSRPPLECVDTDRTADEEAKFTRGAVVWEDGQFLADFCADDFTVQESSCGEEGPISTPIRCPYGCGHGRCYRVEESPFVHREELPTCHLKGVHLEDERGAPVREAQAETGVVLVATVGGNCITAEDGPRFTITPSYVVDETTVTLPPEQGVLSDSVIRYPLIAPTIFRSPTTVTYTIALQSSRGATLSIPLVVQPLPEPPPCELTGLTLLDSDGRPIPEGEPLMRGSAVTVRIETEGCGGREVQIFHQFYANGEPLGGEYTIPLETGVVEHTFTSLGENHVEALLCNGLRVHFMVGITDLYFFTVERRVGPKPGDIVMPSDLEKLRQNPYGDYTVICDLEDRTRPFSPIPEFWGSLRGVRNLRIHLIRDPAAPGVLITRADGQPVEVRGGFIGVNHGTIERLSFNNSPDEESWSNLTPIDPARHQYIGGMIGLNRGRVNHVWHYGRLLIDGQVPTTNVTVGGLVGLNEGSIEMVLSDAPDLFVGRNSVFPPPFTNTIVGGVTGENRGGTLAAAFAHGVINASSALAGGAIGVCVSSPATIERVGTAVSVDAYLAGGVVGLSNECSYDTITNAGHVVYNSQRNRFEFYGRPISFGHPTHELRSRTSSGGLIGLMAGELTRIRNFLTTAEFHSRLSGGPFPRCDLGVFVGKRLLVGRGSGNSRLLLDRGYADHGVRGSHLCHQIPIYPVGADRTGGGRVTASEFHFNDRYRLVQSSFGTRTPIAQLPATVSGWGPPWLPDGRMFIMEWSGD